MLDMSKLEPRIQDATQLLEMLSQPTRLKILCLLFEGEHSVLTLAAEAGISQPAMSHHLRKLRDTGLVQTRRDGQTIYYRLKGSQVEAVLETLHRLYCA